MKLKYFAMDPWQERSGRIEVYKALPASRFDRGFDPPTVETELCPIERLRVGPVSFNIAVASDGSLFVGQPDTDAQIRRMMDESEMRLFEVNSVRETVRVALDGLSGGAQARKKARRMLRNIADKRRRKP